MKYDPETGKQYARIAPTICGWWLMPKKDRTPIVYIGREACGTGLAAKNRGTSPPRAGTACLAVALFGQL